MVQSGEASMVSVTINEYLLSAAIELIQTSEPADLTLIPLSEKSSASAGLSRNPDDIMVLEEIEHNGITYYLGIPRS